MPKPRTEEIDDLEPVVPLTTAISILLATAIGTATLALLFGQWLPGLTASIFGPQPQAFWDLSRSSAIAAYLLLWLSVVSGLLITNRMGRSWLSVQNLVDVHQFSSLLGLSFGLFHGLILLGDKYIGFTLWQVVTPFTSFNYQPFWVGLGQLAFYVALPVTFTFYIRKTITTSAWRAIHYGSFIVYAFISVHAMLAGSDTLALPILLMYAITNAVFLYLTLKRIIDSPTAPASQAKQSR
jgi:predicted ferric reductase